MGSDNRGLNQAEKNLEIDLEEGTLKVTKNFIKSLRDLAKKQKHTVSVEQFANALGVKPKEELFKYTDSDLDNCEIEIIED